MSKNKTVEVRRDALEILIESVETGISTFPPEVRVDIEDSLALLNDDLNHPTSSGGDA